jgi:hypothetical protein
VDDPRLKKIRKRGRRRREPQPLDVGLIIVTLIGSGLVCVILGSVFRPLRWLILISGSMYMLLGAVLVCYTLYKLDDKDMFNPRGSPYTAGAGMIGFFGFVQLILYVFLANG